MEPAPSVTTRVYSWLGLNRPALRAWALYDWGNSGFVTTVVAAVFPIYFAEVAARGLTAPAATVRFSAATTVAMILAAVISPVLGKAADRRGSKLPWLRISTGVAVAASAALGLVGPGDWRAGLALFIVANVALGASLVFYDALLPDLASRQEIDRVSSAGYALGYIGGAILLSLNLLWLRAPARFGFADSEAAARASFVSVALWWTVFAFPLRPGKLSAALRARATPTRQGGRGLRGTLRGLREHRSALLMLIAFLLFNDGIGTIIRMATIYGVEIGLGRNAMIAALLVTQLVGVPFTFLFGALGARIGPKPAIFVGLAVYLGVTVLAFFMRTNVQFLLLAFLVGTVQGGTQALSRSFYATLIPQPRAGEFFGFFSIADKFAGVLGPAIFTAVTALTGSSRSAVGTTALLFLFGGALLAFVQPPPPAATGTGGQHREI
jgi:MFS transporter, UMF1 family